MAAFEALIERRKETFPGINCLVLRHELRFDGEPSIRADAAGEPHRDAQGKKSAPVRLTMSPSTASKCRS